MVHEGDLDPLLGGVGGDVHGVFVGELQVHGAFRLRNRFPVEEQVSGV